MRTTRDLRNIGKYSSDKRGRPIEVTLRLEYNRHANKLEYHEKFYGCSLKMMPKGGTRKKQRKNPEDKN